MEINDRKVIHTNLIPDQSDKADDIVLITVTEKRTDVPYTWGKGFGDGYKAKDKKGNAYECHWDSYPDDSMNPNCHWIRVTGEPDMFWDITETRAIPFRPKFLDGEIGEIMDYCPEHEDLFYKAGNGISEGCFDCYLDKTYPDSEQTLSRKKAREKRKTWVGWK